MSKEVYKDEAGNIYDCDHIQRKGNKLVHSETCRKYGRKQCPYYKQCTGFTKKVNWLNSAKYKEIQEKYKQKDRFQKLVKESAKKLEQSKNMKERHDDLAILEYANNINTYRIQDKKVVKDSRILKGAKRSMAEGKQQDREKRRNKIKRTKHTIRQIRDSVRHIENEHQKDKIIKELCKAQGINYITKAERNIKKRRKAREERGIILDKVKAKRVSLKKRIKDLSRYENAVTLSFEEDEGEIYEYIDEEDGEEIIFSFSNVEQKEVEKIE